MSYRCKQIEWWYPENGMISSFIYKEPFTVLLYLHVGVFKSSRWWLTLNIWILLIYSKSIYSGYLCDILLGGKWWQNKRNVPDALKPETLILSVKDVINKFNVFFNRPEKDLKIQKLNSQESDLDMYEFLSSQSIHMWWSMQYSDNNIHKAKNTVGMFG